MFLEISWNSQENTCAKVSFLIKLQVAAFDHGWRFCMRIKKRNRAPILHKSFALLLFFAKLFFIKYILNQLLTKWPDAKWLNILFKPPITTHHHPPPSTTTHHQPRYIHQHPPPSTTTHHQPKYIRHHPPPTHHQPKHID